MIELRTTTYGCICGYKVDAKAFENVDYFTTFSQGFGVSYGTCPSCRDKQLAKLLELSEFTTHNVPDDVDLAAIQKEATDTNGQPVLIQTGEREKLDIINGVPGVVTEPVMESKLRDLTDAELTALKLQRNQSLDELEKVAAKLVSRLI